MWHTMTKEEIRRKLRTDFQEGLTEEEVKRRQKEYGENKLEEKKKTNIFIKFLLQFNDFMIIILLLAAGISAAMSYLEGSGDYIDSIIIIAIVVFNACMGLIQESKAEKALEALTKLAAPVAKVKREGRIKEIPVAEVVPGDIVILEAGNFVPADSRIIEASRLGIEESALTGETVPVNKDAFATLENNISTGDMVNMAFATTTVTNGHGEAVVCDIGMKTKVGQIARLILSDEAPETPLQRKLRRSGEKVRVSSIVYLFSYFYHRNFKTNTLDANVYDISGTGSGSYTRGIACYCYYPFINRSNENG